MNISTVNELIQSLESAGELSIKEAKVMALAKAYQQLAAENVGMKSFGDTLHEIKSSLVGGGHGHMAKADMQAQSAVMDVIFDAFDAIETPATDRIVAGIKADGVEMFVEKCREKSKQAISSDIRDNWWLASEHADDFAKQLREGAK
ncbi:hypothetical protein [Klebsiella grimontii]|uniref:hypothetical protein n=1 Tax=Klebsiella grimontii TaxID=2058152 RepID=UPI0012B8EFFE|nr:hypothetical protein [Klebsiella grimontii]